MFGFDFTSMLEAGDQCLRVKWSQKVKDAQVEGDEIPNDLRERFQGAAKAGPQRWNPRGERLTPVLLK